ncbi:acyl-CoA dehydrogenase family protein [Pseudomonas nitroreducens]|uniref:acyl-CoA dehydrogenase family protein n=1 Tax=Pseudomonas nitroreducens TaxID=46680 RepID=UPI002D80C715|nr:acyl-CoA dehydrogenase family protein [Pseudomonas nitroreducens]
MNFELSSEQQMLQDSVRRFIDKEYSFEARVARLQAGEGSDSSWTTFAEQGWLCAALPEVHGGLGGNIVDSVVIAQELGRGLVLAPYAGCAVLAAQTLVAAAAPEHQKRWLPALADGSARLALAYAEVQTRGLVEGQRASAKRHPGGYRLNGRKTLVMGGTQANAFIISAQAEEGCTLFLVEADLPGLGLIPVPLHDGSWVVELQLSQVDVSEAAVLGRPGEGLAALRQGLAQATACLCAELVGGMERVIEISADYLKVRQQFGVPIGSFQSLQHRMADMAAQLELARSALFVLLDAIDNPQIHDLQLRTSQIKAQVGRAAKFVCGQAIQLHGGIGTTEECSVGHYFKRAVVADLLLGSADSHEAYCTQRQQAALADAAMSATMNSMTYGEQ